MTKKYRIVFIGFVVTAITSISALANNTVTCPIYSDIVCTGGHWTVTGNSNWSSSRLCTTGKVATSFKGAAATETTYYSDKSTFASGDFAGDYIPLQSLLCVYNTNDSRGIASMTYSGTDEGSKATFTMPSSSVWTYQTSSYLCISSTYTDCGLTTS